MENQWIKVKQKKLVVDKINKIDKHLVNITKRQKLHLKAIMGNSRCERWSMKPLW